MSVETHRILIGSCGWKHPEWLDSFYSDDLPDDWQLGFYSNEFPVVYVETEDWLHSDVLQWTEDVSDSFRFILEISSNILLNDKLFAEAINKAKSLEDLCLGFVIQVEDNIEISHLEKKITLAQEVAPVCVDSMDDFLSKWFIEKQLSTVWDGVSELGETLALGQLAVTRISGQDFDMPKLRYVIEGCLSASDESRISVLFIDGKPPSLELLRNADIILNLL
ncbi:MAG: hypothetical protein QM484_02720 [Woeseiaceae bacterium]